jgi:hypothetical protein
MCEMKYLIIIFAAFLYWTPVLLIADQQDELQEESSITDPASKSTSEPAQDKPKFKILSKKPENLLLVPIPMSSPTFGTGLILGGAYFYPQTEEQKDTQPASFTGSAAGYTSNDSWVAGVMQQNYWNEDKWRFTGVAGYLDLRLEITPSSSEEFTESLGWLVSGAFVQTRISRQLRGNWYMGVTARYLDITQSLDRNLEDDQFNLQSNIRSAGIGLNLDFDSRDMPTNPYSGRHLEIKAMTNTQSNTDADSYQAYQARIRSYHPLSETMVLAWDINGCSKSGQIPLWDACRLGLRGFSATDYQGKQSLYGQAEFRWRFYKKWGMVTFAGAGRVEDTFAGLGENETIPSYGVGLRFMALESQRINIRVDYARSNNGNAAFYLSVTEAF